MFNAWYIRSHRGSVVGGRPQSQAILLQTGMFGVEKKSVKFNCTRLLSAPLFLEHLTCFYSYILFLFPIFLRTIFQFPKHNLLFSTVIKEVGLGVGPPKCWLLSQIGWSGRSGLVGFIYLFIALEVSIVPRRLPKFCGMGSLFQFTSS